MASVGAIGGSAGGASAVIDRIPKPPPQPQISAVEVVGPRELQERVATVAMQFARTAKLDIVA